MFAIACLQTSTFSFYLTWQIFFLNFELGLITLKSALLAGDCLNKLYILLSIEFISHSAMTMGFQADFKDLRISLEMTCPINAEFKYLTATLLVFSSQYLDTKCICPFLETSLSASSKETTKKSHFSIQDNSM